MPEQQDNLPTMKVDDLTGLRCPKCDYELTGLTQMQCAECGQAFDPQALRVLQANSSAKPASLESYARFIRNCAIVNLIVQLSVSILNENAGFLHRHGLLGYETLGIIQAVGFGCGILGGAIGMSLAFFAIIHAGIRNCYSASWLAFTALILSAFAGYLSILNFS